MSACAPGPWSEIFLAVCEPRCKKGYSDIGEAALKSVRQVVIFSILPDNQVARISHLATLYSS